MNASLSGDVQVDPGHSRRVNGNFALHPLAFALACLVVPGLALALPEGFNPVGGSVTQSLATPGVMNLQQGTDRAIVNWNSFSIGQAESVNISQPGVSSMMLNRVTGALPSSITGSLTANGRVFLVNPNGVVFGAGSRVSTGGLVASTLNISDDDFNAGRWSFSRADGNQAAVINRGKLQAGPGGTIALLGAVVRNEGSIKADGGTAALVSARQLTLDFEGDGLTTFRIDPANPASEAVVQNAATGVVQADGGRVAILADASSSAQLVVNQEGVLRARSLVQREGEVILGVGSDDRAVVGGLLDASGGTGLKGGKVNISGGGLYLNDQAVVDVGGATGGGRVDVRATQSAALAKGSTLTADARTDGKGGTLNLQGGASLRAYGTLQARGAGSGAGGFVETSAKAVDLAGLTVQTSGAPGQLAGTWLIDPFDITVTHGTGNEDVCCVLDAPFDPVIANSTVFDGVINTALNNGSDVRIHTGPATPTDVGGQITIADGVFIRRSQGSDRVKLSFEANESIIGSNFFIVSDTGPLDVVFNANANGFGSGGAEVNLSFASDGDSVPDSRSFINTHGGSVSIFGGTDSSTTVKASVLDPAILLDGVDIDTRDARSVGSVFMRGYSAETIGIELDSSTIFTGAGNVALDGLSVGSLGLLLFHTQVNAGDGNISIVGSGSDGGGGIEFNSGNVSTTGGNVILDGSSDDDTGVFLGGGSITANQGSVQINGNTLTGTAGIEIDGLPDPFKINTVGGDITVIGLAGQDADELAQRSGLILRGGTSMTTDTGNIDLRGRVASAEAGESAGILFDLSGGAFKISSLTGNVSLAGEATNGSDTNGLRVITSTLGATGTVFAGNRLDIRAASNEPTQLAFDLGDLSLTGAAQTSLRPGGVDITGALAENNATAIQLGSGPDGSTPVSNFQISQQILDQLHTPRLTLGSATQAAPIVVAGNITVGSGKQLILQAEGSGGSIDLRAPLTAMNGTLALLADGQISQTNTGALTSEQLLAISRNGSVLLNNPTNAPHVVAGRAAQAFSFINADNLSIGTVDGVSGVQAGSVFIRNLDGDLTLDQPVTATAGSAVLVTGGRLQNPAGQTISASSFWQIWANTWIGENRGALAGSGSLPNLYGCAFGGACASASGLAATAGDNHFIYLQQPTAQITIGSGAGPFGITPRFRTNISGLILGDTGNGISGSPDSEFSQIARPGTFSVGGTFTSAEGYLLTVVPGTWTNYLFGPVDARPDWTRERPDTWLYDHNMGGAAMCAAPGVTIASAVQEGDVLAREWSLVKSRPKLSSCVASDKQNGCSDF